MDFNKDLIVRVLLALAVLMAFIKVVLPVFVRGLKNKMPGSKGHEDDIDFLIKKQKEKIKIKYGINEPNAYQAKDPLEEIPIESQIIQEAIKDSSWGGGKLHLEVKNSLIKNYSYSPSDSKINSFFLMAKKRQYFSVLDKKHADDLQTFTRFLTHAMALHIITEEIRAKDLNFTDMMAKKCKLPPMVLAIAIQIKILSSSKFDPPLKDDKKYIPQLNLAQFQEETLNLAIDKIIKKEGILWAHDQSSFIEELNLFISYAQMLKPFPTIKNKNDLESAYFILGVSQDSTLEEIKKSFKRLAQEYHPDKLAQKALPPYLSMICTKKFNIIRQAYDMVSETRK